MEQTLDRPRLVLRRPLTHLARVHLGSLLGFSLAFVHLQLVLVGEYLPLPTIFIVITLVLAGIVASVRRWTPVLGTLWLILLNGATTNVIGYHFARPENTHDFAFYVVIVGMAVIGVVTGIAATAQNYVATGEHHAPRWLPYLLLSVTALGLGAIAVVLIPRPQAVTSVSREVLADLPALTAANFAFDQPELRARVGETVALRLENTDTATHAFAIPELGVDVPMGSGETSLALFRPSAPGTYTYVCSVPHHEFMRGTLVVEP